MQEIGHWINGKLVAGTSGRFAQVFNPPPANSRPASRWPPRPSWTMPSPRPPRPR